MLNNKKWFKLEKKKNVGLRSTIQLAVCIRSKIFSYLSDSSPLRILLHVGHFSLRFRLFVLCLWVLNIYHISRETRSTYAYNPKTTKETSTG